MSRQTEDGLHEGYVETELVGPWPGEDAMFARFDDETQSWWTASWSNTRPASTGRYRAACARGTRDVHWHGPIVHATPDKFGDCSEHDEDSIMLAWETHIEGDRELIVPPDVEQLAVVIAERDALVEHLAVARVLIDQLADAFRQFTGEYVQELCADVLAAADVVGARAAGGQTVGEDGLLPPSFPTTIARHLTVVEETPR